MALSSAARTEHVRRLRLQDSLPFALFTAGDRFGKKTDASEVDYLDNLMVS